MAASISPRRRVRGPRGRAWHAWRRTDRTRSRASRRTCRRRWTSSLARLADAGLRYAGGLDDSFAQVPTAIGTLRPASVLPAAQAALSEPWRGVGLLLIGFRRYRDAWPGLAADNLRGRRWPGGPQRIEAREVELPALDDLHNLNALTLARHFDDPAWRHAALRAIADAIPAGRWRIGLPAVLASPIMPPRSPRRRSRSAARRSDRQRAAVGAGAAPLRGAAPTAARGRRAAAMGVPGGGCRAGRGSRHRHPHRGRVAHAPHRGRCVRARHRGACRGGIRADPDGTLRERVFGLPVAARPVRVFGDDPLTGAPSTGPASPLTPICAPSTGRATSVSSARCWPACTTWSSAAATASRSRARTGSRPRSRADRSARRPAHDVP